MFVLEGVITERGPFIELKVMQGQQRVEALKKQGKPFARPVTIQGLVDTGASCSALDSLVIKSLNLLAHSEVRVHTPSTGDAYEIRKVYDASLVVGEDSSEPHHQTLAVIESSFASEGFLALIGRDILAHCLLMYDGPARRFSLQFAGDTGTDS